MRYVITVSTVIAIALGSYAIVSKGIENWKNAREQSLPV